MKNFEKPLALGGFTFFIVVVVKILYKITITPGDLGYHCFLVCWFYVAFMMCFACMFPLMRKEKKRKVKQK